MLKRTENILAVRNYDADKKYITIIVIIISCKNITTTAYYYLLL